MLDSTLSAVTRFAKLSFRRWASIKLESRLFFVCIAGVVAMLIILAARSRVQYNITDLGTLGGERSEAYGINNAGQVVGGSSMRGRGRHAFLWESRRGMIDLDKLGGIPGDNSFAGDINNNGQVVVNTIRSNLIWQAGHRLQYIGLPKGIYFAVVRAINDNGQVVGGCLPMSHGFLWEDGEADLYTGEAGGYAMVKGINNAGQVVGSVESGDHIHAFLCKRGIGSRMRDLGTLKGGRLSWANDINDAGLVVGESDNENGCVHAFLWQEGRGMIDMGSLNGEDSGAKSINNAGQVVGGPAITGEKRNHPAFLYSDGQMMDLNTTIDPALGWHLSDADDINDSGQIVGTGKNPEGKSHAFLLTPVSRSYVFLWGLGAIVLFGFTWLGFRVWLIR